MSLPKLAKTDELVAALRELDKLRTDFFVEGMDLEHFDEIVSAVRTVDAETVTAIHRRRDEELYPYFPESYAPEEDGYEAAEVRLRADMPKEEEL